MGTTGCAAAVPLAKVASQRPRLHDRAGQGCPGAGVQVLTDFHYSDTWADPGKQFTPAAWKGKSHEELVRRSSSTRATPSPRSARQACCLTWCRSATRYQRHALARRQAAWRWHSFADLVKAGIRGVEAGLATARAEDHDPHRPRRRPRGTKAFFDRLNSYHVDYDVIGQSYYPWWHGSLLDLRETSPSCPASTRGHPPRGSGYCWRPPSIVSDPARFRNSRRPAGVPRRGEPAGARDARRPWHRRVLVGTGRRRPVAEPWRFATMATPCRFSRCLTDQPRTDRLILNWASRHTSHRRYAEGLILVPNAATRTYQVSGSRNRPLIRCLCPPPW